MDIEQHYLRSMLDQMREPPEPVEGAGGAAFGVFPAMRSAASRTGEISPAGRMLPADVAAGAAKGMITGGVGLPGDIESLIRGVRGIFQRGGDQGKLDAFLAGMEEKTILPTSEDVSKWLDANVGPVVPPGAPMAKERAGVAAAGQMAGEIVSGPGTLVKGAKAGAAGAAATAKFVKPKVGEMLSSYMSRSGLTPELMAFHGTPVRFAVEEGAPLGRFRSEKIGSGQKAQAYGYGLYFAESPDLAQGYRIGLSNTQSGGSLYTVDIPDEMIGRMLDWDEPLINQSQVIQQLAKQYNLTDPDHLGGDLVNAVGAKRPAGAKILREAGIPGIRYLDQSTRRTNRQEVARNIVVFPGEEDKVKILKVE